MFKWLKSLFTKSPKPKQFPQGHVWEDLLVGDFVRVILKNPDKVGIDPSHRSMTFQRLDAEDLETRKVEGYVIGTERRPGPIDTLMINVVKRRGGQTRLVVYTLLKEEIEYIKMLMLGDE